MTRSRWSGWRIIALFVVVAVTGVAWTVYDRLWREPPQPDWILQTKPGESFGDTQFKYLSVGVERNAGIPYWVFYVLPMMFPEKLPGIGGYSAFGLPWEEGIELPIGFIKRTIGYPRVGINCALCHTTRFRKYPDTKPEFVPAGPGNTANIEALSRFLYECAQDPRFNSDSILAEIGNFTKLDWIDRFLYRFLIIPASRERILKGGEHLLWSYRSEIAAWGRGSDGPTYSSIYVRDDPRPDGRYGSSQFPPIWNLAKYHGKNGRGQPQQLNATGDGRDVYSVITDSILGLLGRGQHDSGQIERDAKALSTYLERKPAPSYPYDQKDRIEPEKVDKGRTVFEKACATCHAENSPLVGRPMRVADVQTDPEYAAKWINMASADYVPSYIVPHLDGIWLRGPYLHNGSVPTIWDLLTSTSQRPKHFYRGYDMLDSERLGFVSQGDDAKRYGTPFDTTKKGNGNQGHEYGADLLDDEKTALIEFMKTL